ncbi:MAG: hypothetical protein ACRDD7_01415 [Peptostreptococcaceae bacterium]
MMKIYIGNDNIKINDLGVYCAISYLSNAASDEVLFSVKQIAYVLYGTMRVSRYKVDTIKKHISNLVDGGYVSMIEECSGEYIAKNTFVVDGINGKFTILSLTELRKIYSSSGDTDKLLRYFIFLISTVNQDKKCGWYSVDAMSVLLNMHKTTILDYNTILENLDLIYIHRNKATIKDENGEYRRVNNTYGRIGDKATIDKYASEYAMSIGICNNQININSRSVSKRYNDFVNGVFKGDVDELIMECRQYNKIYMRIGNGERVKDMSVFEESEVDLFEADDSVGIYDNGCMASLADDFRLLFG